MDNKEEKKIDEIEEKVDKNDSVTMAFQVYEELAKANQTIRDINTKLINAIKVIVIGFLITIALMTGGFLWYNSLPIYDVTVDGGDGYANYIGNDLSGDIYNGENPSKETGGQE